MTLIQTEKNCSRFLLRTGNSSYAFGINTQGLLTGLHWGGLIENISDLPSAREIECYRHRNIQHAALNFQEYPGWGSEFFNEPSLKATLPGGMRSIILRYAG
ncbi:MAG TPA: hypothetical protein DC049_04270, partial [Spirochaetia bacterium]|nr:hypothetical protein [Spirochaetia bacterium]